MATGAIRVHGLKELTRAFKAMPDQVVEEFVWELEEAANPVKMEAQSLAVSEIRNMPPTPFYADMRIGVAKSQGLVYMVPAWRSSKGAGRRRPNLADLLMDRAMDPAAEHNENKVIDKIEDMLDRIADSHGF